MIMVEVIMGQVVASGRSMFGTRREGNYNAGKLKCCKYQGSSGIYCGISNDNRGIRVWKLTRWKVQGKEIEALQVKGRMKQYIAG